MMKKSDFDHINQWQSFNRYLKEVANKKPDSIEHEPALGKYFNRDLSWLQFNDRVLSEAADESVPPLERLRFAGITSSNLDEFFMVRIAEIARFAKQDQTIRYPDGLTPSRLLSQIRDYVLRQKGDQAAILRDILSVLAKEGILIYTEFGEDAELDQEIQKHLPELKFLTRQINEPLPPLMSDRIHVFVRFPDGYAVITIDDRAARLLKLPSSPNILRFALLERWLSARAPGFFPNREVIEAFPFKIIRDADLRYHPDNEETLEEQIVEAVQSRVKARIVRLEVDAPHYSEGSLFLATGLGLDSAALYRFSLPLDLRTLATIYNQGHPRLRYNTIKPLTPPLLTGTRDIFDSIRKKDVLLHHPYDSFDVVVKFLHSAAKDPHVTHIYHTMYRTTRESPLMEALKEAAKQGKKVTVYIEIKARFDELNNVRWATELRKAGVKVVQPLGGFKVHCKLTQVLRKEGPATVSYLHLGTGNYHPGTALQYTDLGLFTCNADLGSEVSKYFQSFVHRADKPKFHHLLAAPINLHQGFLNLIQEERRIQEQSGKGHIIAKMNSLVDPDIINALYEASTAGVKIELLVRGICCLRPGVKGMSENIKVISIVDRFLEHSRIYYFRAGGQKRIFLSSADWMPRNFYTRYEVAFPIHDPALKKFIREVVLATSLADNTKSWLLKSNGTYERVDGSSMSRQIRSQFQFEALAKAGYQNTVLEGRK